MAHDWLVKYISGSNLGLRQSEGVILGKGRTSPVVKRLLTLSANIVLDATFRKWLATGLWIT